MVRKKILYIDPLLQRGHVNFNNIFIESLRKEDYLLNFVFVGGYEKELKLEESEVIYSIPKFLFRKDFGKIGNRLSYFIALILIRLFVNFKSYDSVIFSSFEEISFFFSGIKKCHLVNHINVSTSYKSDVKFFFLDRIMRKNTLIVLDSDTKRYLDLKGSYDIVVQPHGLPRKKVIDMDSIEPEFRYVLEKIEDYDGILFSPSDGSSDKLFLNELVQNSTFLAYLEVNNILFIYRNSDSIIHKNLMQINGFLGQKTYDFLFLNCSFVLIAYPDSFKYRVSGVLLEAFANHKPCIISKIDSLVAYSKFFNYIPFYTNVDELINVLIALKAFEQKHDDYYCNLNVLEPKCNYF